MTTAKTTVMVADADQVIDGVCRLRIDDVRCHVQSLSGEFDQGIQLVAKRPRVRETFQMNDEYFW